MGIDKATIYRWMEPGSDVAETERALSLLQAAGVISDEERDSCMPDRANGSRVNREAVMDLIVRVRGDGNQRAAGMLSKCTHMIPPAVVGAGDEYAAALRRRADALRAEMDEMSARGEDATKVARRLAAIGTASKENMTSDAGRSVWVLEDVERFAIEIGRLRTAAGRPKKRA